MKPTKSILDSTRPYVCAAKTDLKKSFAKYRKDIADEAKAKREDELEKISRTVTPFKR